MDLPMGLRTNTTGPRRLASIVAVVVALVLAGCTGPDDPTVTPAPASPSASAAVAPDGATTRPVRIFLVLVGDRVPAGSPTFGCGDAIQAVDRDVPAAEPALETALRALLAERTASDPTAGPYSVFNASRLTLESATVAGGTATIHLRGELRLGGVCDSPRVEEQLTRTAGQFPEVTAVEVFVNGVPLADVLSGR